VLVSYVGADIYEVEVKTARNVSDCSVGNNGYSSKMFSGGCRSLPPLLAVCQFDAVCP
jgi:hypothetical protein